MELIKKIKKNSLVDTIKFNFLLVLLLGGLPLLIIYLETRVLLNQFPFNLNLSLLIILISCFEYKLRKISIFFSGFLFVIYIILILTLLLLSLFQFFLGLVILIPFKWG